MPRPIAIQQPVIYRLPTRQPAADIQLLRSAGQRPGRQKRVLEGTVPTSKLRWQPAWLWRNRKGLIRQTQMWPRFYKCMHG